MEITLDSRMTIPPSSCWWRTRVSGPQPSQPRRPPRRSPRRSSMPWASIRQRWTQFEKKGRRSFPRWCLRCLGGSSYPRRASELIYTSTSGNCGGLLGRREDIAGRRRTSDALRTRDPEVHPARVDGLKHRFGRSGLALRDAELLERCRPPGPRHGKGFDVELQDFTQLGGDFIRADHRSEFDDSLP